MLVKLVISIFLIVIVVRASDIEKVMDRLLSVDLLTISFAIFLTISLSLVHVVRWRAVIAASGNQLSFLKAIQIIMIGYFFNQALPSSVGGDAVRIWRVYREGFDLSSAVNTVLLDRLIALAALLIMAVTALPWLKTIIDDTAVFGALLAVIFIGLTGFSLLMIFDRLPPFLLQWKLTQAVSKLADTSRKVFLQKRYCLPALASSIVIHLSVAFIVFIIARVIDSNIDLIDCMLLVPPVILLTTLPISIAGWGIREGAMVIAFGSIGVEPSNALALSILFGVVLMLASLPGGIIWLLSGHSKVRPISTIQS